MLVLTRLCSSRSDSRYQQTMTNSNDCVWNWGVDIGPGRDLRFASGESVSTGIDILDLSGETPVYAAQCKLKEEHKSLQPAEIQAERTKAKNFATLLGKYAILTTRKVSTQSQLAVRDINQAHRAQGLWRLNCLHGIRSALCCSNIQPYRRYFMARLITIRPTKSTDTSQPLMMVFSRSRLRLPVTTSTIKSTKREIA